MPCLGIPTIGAFKIVETDASNVGYGGILKQRVSPESPEQIVRFYSGIWNNAQLNYSTMYFKISKWFVKSKVFVTYWLQKC